MDYERIPAGNRNFIIILFFVRRNIRIQTCLSLGNSALLHHLINLRTVYFILDTDTCTYLSGIQCLCHYQREHSPITYHLSAQPDWTRNGNQCNGSCHIRSSRAFHSKRHTCRQFMALVICHQHTFRTNSPDTRTQISTPERRTFQT